MNWEYINSKLLGNSTESLKAVISKHHRLPLIMNEFNIPVYSLQDESLKLAKLDQSHSKLYSFFKGMLKFPAYLTDETKEEILNNINHMLSHDHYVRITVSLEHLPEERRGTGYVYNIINLFNYDRKAKTYTAFGNDEEHRYRPFLITENELLDGMKNISDQVVEIKYYTYDVKEYLEILSKYIKSYETSDNIFGQNAFLQYMKKSKIENEFLILLFEHFLLTKQRLEWLHENFVVSPVNLEEYDLVTNKLKQTILDYIDNENSEQVALKEKISDILNEENQVIYDFIKRFYAWNDRKLRVM